MVTAEQVLILTVTVSSMMALFAHSPMKLERLSNVFVLVTTVLELPF